MEEKFFLLTGEQAHLIGRVILIRNLFTPFQIYPVLKWTFLHGKSIDTYCFYTLAGPTYISKTIVDNKELGRHFTFQDNMGMGLFFGEKRNYNIEFKIGHYSNGDLFPSNDGVKVPLSLNIGYSF